LDEKISIKSASMGSIAAIGMGPYRRAPSLDLDDHSSFDGIEMPRGPWAMPSTCYHCSMSVLKAGLFT